MAEKVVAARRGRECEWVVETESGGGRIWTVGGLVDGLENGT